MKLHTGNTQTPVQPSRKPPPKATLWRAIREKCLACVGTIGEIRECDCVSCRLWPIRMGPRKSTAKKGPDGKMLPMFRKRALLRAIKRECVSCCGNAAPGVVCRSPRCALYPFRRGPHSVKGV